MSKHSYENRKVNKIKVTICILLIVLLIIGIVMFIVKKIDDKNNNVDISNAIHGVVLEEKSIFYRKPKISKWKRRREFEIGENVYILEEITDEQNNNWYKVKAKDKVGYVLKDKVEYYTLDEKSDKVLMSDVSKFNIQFEHFKKAEDYEVFILKSKINYVYIRAGGRGYGEEGNFYTDPQFQIFINACEYLKIPYGFYYINEATSSEEIDEEVDFIKKFIDENATEYCKLPLAIDAEEHDGVGRADEIWNNRKFLTQELIDKFKLQNIDTIVYSNARTAHKYLTEVETKFWLAYYNLENKVPDYWYTETNQEPTQNIELMSKLIGWQFTENGAGSEIPYKVDLNLVDNKFFLNYIK